MPSDRVRVVVDNSFDEDQFLPVAGQNQWWMHERHERDGDEPSEFIYKTRDSATFLHWIEDHKLGVTYILVKGPATQQVVQTLRASVKNYSPEDIMGRARKLQQLPPDERRKALYHLALDKMEHGFDQETFDVVSTAMRDSNPEVRGSAVLASAYLGWPELANPMRPLASTSEPDASIRKDAALLVARLDKLAARN